MCLGLLERCARLVATERWRRFKRGLTYFIIATNFFLGGFEYGIIFPTALHYLQSMGAADGRDTLYFSLLIVCYAMANILGGYVGGLWADTVVETRPLLVLAAVPQIAGNALYFFGTTPDQLVLSRALSGIGSGANTAMIAEITRTTSLKQRTAVISMITFARQLGIVFGPAIGSYISGLPDVFQHRLTLLNAPGFLMTILYLCYLLLLTVGYSNLTVEEDEHQFDAETRSEADGAEADPPPSQVAGAAAGPLSTIDDAESGPSFTENDARADTTTEDGPKVDKPVVSGSEGENAETVDIKAAMVGDDASAEKAVGAGAGSAATHSAQVETAVDGVAVEPPPSPESGGRRQSSAGFVVGGRDDSPPEAQPARPLLLALPCASSPQVQSSWPPYQALAGWRTPASTTTPANTPDARDGPPPERGRPPTACPHCGKSLVPAVTGAAPPPHSMVSEWRALLRWPVLVVLLCNFSAYMATCSLEATLPVLVEQDLRRDINSTGNAFIAGGVVQCVVLLLMMFTSRFPALVDQRLITAGLAIMALAHIELSVWLVRLRDTAAHRPAGGDADPPGDGWYALLIVGGALQFLGYPLVNSVATSFLSKLLSRGAQGVGAAGLRVSMCAGLMLGPLWGASLLHHAALLMVVPLLLLTAGLAAFSATERRSGFAQPMRVAAAVDLVTPRVVAAPRRVRTISTLTLSCHAGLDGGGTAAGP